MLPYENRLLKAKDFEVVSCEGSFFSSGEVFLKIKKNSKKISRIGFSIGIKFSSKAVERNQAKRKLREIFRKNIGNIKPGFDILVFLKKKEKKDFLVNCLEKDSLSVLKKANLI